MDFHSSFDVTGTQYSILFLKHVLHVYIEILDFHCFALIFAAKFFKLSLSNLI